MSNIRHISLISHVKNMLLPIIFVSIIAMMVIPIPPILLDIFFTFNILIGLVVAMVSLNTNRPLDFSSFPTVILLSTVLRLALNVASTRVILVNGHNGANAAGDIIKTFGEFIIGGNYAVGILVFAILIIINLIVITKGAGRVSEVSARFTLDAMPGKQMAIDADMSAGLITNEVAKQRREDIARESDFYGSMDGASKFVKGDAVAGIIILLINIVGGLVIGTLSHGLPLAEAADFYVRLTVGDGLVAQIPSILLSLATAIIITRVSEKQELDREMASQISLPKAWIPVTGIMLLMGLIPGIPIIIMWTAAGISGYFAWKFQMKEKISSSELSNDDSMGSNDDTSNNNEIQISDISETGRIRIEIGYALTKMLEEGEQSPLVVRITGIRKKLSRKYGIVIPVVRIRDNISMEPQNYNIAIGSVVVGEDKVFPSHLLAINAGNVKLSLPGIKTIDPSFGLESVWIEQHDKDRAKSAGYTVVDPGTVIATHLSQVLEYYIEDLIGQDDVQGLLDNLAESSPNLVSNIVPKLVPLHTITQILKNLLAEKVSISDIRRILEAISLHATSSKDSRELTEKIRPSLGWLIVQNLGDLRSPLQVTTMDTSLESLLLQGLQQGGDQLNIEPSLLQKVGSLINDEHKRAVSNSRPLVIVTSPAIRYPLFSILRSFVNDIVVISIKEIPDTKKVEIVSTIGK